MTTSLFNIEAVITPTDAKRAISIDRPNAKLIRESIGNPDELNPQQFDKAVYCALRLSVSVEGFTSRFVARHYSFLRYWSPIKSWVFAVKNDLGKIEWRPVSENSVYELMTHMIKHSHKELRYIHAAADIGIVSSERVKEAYALPHTINAILSSTPDLNAIFNACRVKLNQNFNIAGEPITPKSKRVGDGDVVKKPLGRPRGRKNNVAVLSV